MPSAPSLSTIGYFVAWLVRSRWGYNELRLLFKRLAAQVGVTLPPGAAIHGLRHRFAHQALGAGIDGLHLQQLMGHSDPITTARYVREHPAALRSVHQRMFDA